MNDQTKIQAVPVEKQNHVNERVFRENLDSKNGEAIMNRFAKPKSVK
jgi:hypothetical protein